MTETVFIYVQTTRGIFSRDLDVTGLTDEEIDIKISNIVESVFSESAVISYHWEPKG